MNNFVNRGWELLKKLILKSPRRIRLCESEGLTWVQRTVRRLSSMS